MSNQSVFVRHLVGQAWVVKSDGTHQAVYQGMQLPEGAVVEAGSGAVVEVVDAQGLVVEPETEQTAWAWNDADRKESSDAVRSAQAVQHEGILQAPLTLFEELEPTELALQGGEGAGSSFTRLDSVAEQTQMLAMDFAAQQLVPLADTLRASGVTPMAANAESSSNWMPPLPEPDPAPPNTLIEVRGNFIANDVVTEYAYGEAVGTVVGANWRMEFRADGSYSLTVELSPEERARVDSGETLIFENVFAYVLRNESLPGWKSLPSMISFHVIPSGDGGDPWIGVLDDMALDPAVSIGNYREWRRDKDNEAEDNFLSPIRNYEQALQTETNPDAIASYRAEIARLTYEYNNVFLPAKVQDEQAIHEQLKPMYEGDFDAWLAQETSPVQARMSMAGMDANVTLDDDVSLDPETKPSLDLQELLLDVSAFSDSLSQWLPEQEATGSHATGKSEDHVFRGEPLAAAPDASLAEHPYAAVQQWMAQAKAQEAQNF